MDCFSFQIFLFSILADRFSLQDSIALEFFKSVYLVTTDTKDAKGVTCINLSTRVALIDSCLNNVTTKAITNVTNSVNDRSAFKSLPLTSDCIQPLPPQFPVLVDLSCRPLVSKLLERRSVHPPVNSKLMRKSVMCYKSKGAFA